jgi:hypothetical protein
MAEGLKRIPAVFYRSANGVEPVRDWLKALPKQTGALSDSTLP